MKPQPASVALFALCAFAVGAAAAQTYPNRPIRFVTAAPGGGNDVSARIIAQGLTERFSQQVIVDNRGGAHVPANTVVAPRRQYRRHSSARLESSRNAGWLFDARAHLADAQPFFFSIIAFRSAKGLNVDVGVA